MCMLTRRPPVHHCPICEKPLARDEANVQCLGHHVEPCPRYHGLSRRGHGGNCRTCLITNEQHWKRHHRIAVLVDQLQGLATKDAEETMIPPASPGEGFWSGAWGGLKLSKKERKAARRLSRTKGRQLAVPTRADVDRVEKALHPEDAAPADTGQQDADVHDTSSVNTTTWSTPSSRRSSLRFRHEAGSAGPDAADLQRILTALGVASSIKSPGSDPEAAKLTRALISAIASDLAQHRIDLRQEANDRADFWQWAPATAYRTWIENGRNWDPKPNDRKRVDSVCSDSSSSRSRNDSLEPNTDAERELRGLKDLNKSEAGRYGHAASRSTSSSSSSSSGSASLTNASTVSVDSLAEGEEWKVVVAPSKKKPVTGRTHKNASRAPPSSLHRKRSAGKVMLKFAHNNGLHHLAPKGKYAHLKEAKIPFKNAWFS